MDQGKIAVRYNKALFELAESKNILEEVYQSILQFREVLQVDEIKHLLENPVIKSSQKAGVLKSVLKEINVHPLLESTVNLMILNKREAYLESLVRLFVNNYKSSKKIRTARLITAKSLGNELHDRMKDLLKGKFKSEIELSEEVNDKIIGGFILRIDDQQLDASVATSLNEIKKKLLNAPLN